MIHGRPFWNIKGLVRTQMPKEKVSQFMRQCDELHSGRVIAIHVHPILPWLFVVVITRDRSDRARFSVACVHPVPLDILFVHERNEDCQSSFINGPMSKKARYIFW